MIDNEPDEVTKELFKTLFPRYIIGLEEGCGFVFHYADLLY